jgi:hypothetical protein
MIMRPDNGGSAASRDPAHHVICRANNYEARPMAVAQRPEVLLATDNKTVLLSLERDGKFSAKSAA